MLLSSFVLFSLWACGSVPSSPTPTNPKTTPPTLSVNPTSATVGQNVAAALGNLATANSYNVAWGDGQSETVSGKTSTTLSHAYTSSGSKTVTLSGSGISAVTSTVTVNAATPTPTPPFPVSGKTLSYQATSENFLNPERGLHFAFQLMENNDYTGLRKGNYKDSNGDPMPVSVAFTYIRLSDFRNSEISADYLQRMRGRFEAARAAGIKLMLRAYYSFGIGEADAPIDRVVQHIGQLAPVFSDYNDVIMSVEGGFIGAWGEWHSSTNNLATPENRRKVINALLQSVPKNRAIQLRYVGAIKEMFPTAMTSAQAFSGSDQSRVGLHNDCFMANFHDAGTYSWDLAPRQADQAYLAQISNFIPTIGETCEVGWPADQRSDCPTTLSEMQRFHWSVISGNWFQPAIARWKSSGCFDEIKRRLGYRFRLVKAVMPDQVNRTYHLKLSFDVYNEGFATPVNAHDVQVVLRNKTSKAVFVMPANTDPRRWTSAQTTSVFLDLTLPSSIVAGDYDVFLNLPDPSPKLASRPEYSIRLANLNTWEAATGYNSLQASIKVN